MFQSSRIASGSPRWHAPSACSPSSASTMSNCKPSRMRRATFRMTLESSTTKQLFITLYSFCNLLAPPASSGNGAVLDVQNTIHVEHDHQLALEPVDAGGDAPKPRVEIRRLRFASVVAKRHHFADRIHQQAIRLGLDLDADRHDRRIHHALAE